MKKIILYVVAAVMFVIGAAGLGNYFYDYYEVSKDEEVLLSSPREEVYETYADAVGWINIDNMRLDNPIMQSDNNEFYLTHNYKGEKARTGAIFLDYRNSPALTDRHSIIYGHVLRNGSMFGELSKYSDQQFANEHQRIEIELLGEFVVLEIFAAYETTTDFYYIETEFTDASYDAFLKKIQQKSQIQMDVAVSVEDQIVTLSTCTTSSDDDERFVVHAKVVERK